MWNSFELVIAVGGLDLFVFVYTWSFIEVGLILRCFLLMVVGCIAVVLTE